MERGLEEAPKKKVNIIELGNFRIVSETNTLAEVAQVFSALVRQNRKVILPSKDMAFMEMFG